MVGSRLANSSVVVDQGVVVVDKCLGISDLEDVQVSLIEIFADKTREIKSVRFLPEEAVGLNILSYFYEKISEYERGTGHQIELEFVSPDNLKLYEFVSHVALPVPEDERVPSILTSIGQYAYIFYQESASYLSFATKVCIEFVMHSLLRAKLRTRELVSEIDKVAVSAVPIVAMVTFLIGIVVSYLLGNQLQYYGANIFVVDGIATAMCRELSPILVAIILAGRSGSAFSAELGSMNMNHEIDSISVLGLSVNQVLVIPRVLALFLCMPILVFVGDLFGILGGLFIANIHLDVGTENFMDRLRQVLYLKNVYIGLCKGPLFALFIGSIACHLGLSAEPNTVSIGRNTTRTVVRSIVSVIILNAICAIVLSEMKL